MAISRCAEALLGLGLALGLFATAASADPTATAAAASSATVSAPSVTHTVDVAVDGFTYEPNVIYANVSDIVLFVFFEGNHSVVRAEYEHPCIPYENLGGGRVGFFSGFRPVAGVPAENGPQFALRVNGTEPVFFYCSAPGACVPNGMIGVINPNETQTLATQELFVKNSSFQLSPGEAPPPESTSSTTSSSSSATLTSTPTGTPIPSSGGGISKGAIGGISAGAVVVVALAAIAFYLCGRNRSLASVVRYSQPPQPKHLSTLPPAAYSPDSHHTDPYTTSPGFKPTTTATSSPLPNNSWYAQSTQPVAENRATSPGFSSPHASGQSPGHAPWSPGGFGGQQQYSPVPQQVPSPHQEMATGQEHNLSPAQSPGLPSRDSYLSQLTARHSTAHHSIAHHSAAHLSTAHLSTAHLSTSHLSTAHLSTSPTPDGQPLQPQLQPQPHVVHEMDASPAASSISPPPEYVGRNFSFSEGSQGEAPGVEKVLRGD